MQRASDVLWHPAAPKRHRLLLRWVLGLAAAAAALALMNGGMPREPDIPGSTAAVTPPVAQPPTRDRVEPVRILNPSRRSAPVLDEPPVRLLPVVIAHRERLVPPFRKSEHDPRHLHPSVWCVAFNRSCGIPIPFRLRTGKILPAFRKNDPPNRTESSFLIPRAAARAG